MKQLIIKFLLIYEIAFNPSFQIEPPEKAWLYFDLFFKLFLLTNYYQKKFALGIYLGIQNIQFLFAVYYYSNNLNFRRIQQTYLYNIFVYYLRFSLEENKERTTDILANCQTGTLHKQILLQQKCLPIIILKVYFCKRSWIYIKLPMCYPFIHIYHMKGIFLNHKIMIFSF